MNYLMKDETILCSREIHYYPRKWNLQGLLVVGGGGVGGSAGAGGGPDSVDKAGQWRVPSSYLVPVDEQLCLTRFSSP